LILNPGLRWKGSPYATDNLMSLQRRRLKSDLPQTVTLSLSPRGEEPSSTDDSVAPAPKSRASHETSTASRTTTRKRRLQRRRTPLVLLQQTGQASVRKVFDLRRFLYVLALTGIVLLLPTPPGLSVEGHRALALFVFTGSILALAPAPLPISALMVPIAQIALGIDTATGAFAPFGQPVVFLILGSLFLAEALRKHGVTRRLALYVFVATRGRFRLLLLGIMLIGGVLSMFVLNTATAAVLIPVAVTIAQRVRQREDAKRALALLILGIGYSASIGSIATIVGSGANVIAAGLLAQVVPFGFLDWMKYGLPIAVVLLPASWLLLMQSIRIPNISIDIQPAIDEIQQLGGVKGPERETIIVLGLAVFLWMTGAQIESVLGLPATLLSSAVIAIGAVALLSIEEIVDWNDLRGVNWGVLFVIGAGLTLGDALDKTGASEWFASLLSPMLEGLPYWLILAALVGGAFALTQFMNNVTLGAILAPILVTLGGASGIPPERLVLPTIIAVSLAYMLPSSSARMTLVAVTGAVEPKDMVRAGLIVGIPSAFFIFFFFLGLSYLGAI
jgi:sodium-dependent dicarboxylate transporter 2/3/5